MIFESLWPLFFLAAVPVIIILYLLKPRGTDYLISSNLLWKKLLKNEQSRTFFEKFVHNILMYLQILIIVLLVLASCIKIVPQACAYVVERLGGYQGTWSVGIHVKVPFIDHIAKKVILKEQVVDFAPQPVITKDNVTMTFSVF